MFAARIDDGDEGFEEDDWHQHSTESGQIPLRADRWWSPGGLTSEMRGGETKTQAVALAFAAISGPERSGGVRSPTICGEVGPETSVGVR